MKNGIIYEQTKQAHRMKETHVHKVVEIYYQLAGEKDYFIHDRTYHIMPGDLVLIGEGVIHKAFSQNLDKSERILVHIDRDYMAGHLPYLELNDFFAIFDQGYGLIRVSAKKQLQLEGLFALMAEVQGRQANGTKEALMLGIGIQLLDMLSGEDLGMDLVTEETGGYVNYRMKEITDYINDYYDQDLTLHKLAKKFNLNVHYLCKLFTKTTGFSSTEYIHLVRIRKAKELLSDQSLNMTHIAETVGYCDSSYFGKVFKKYVGITPLAYRKTYST